MHVMVSGKLGRSVWWQLVAVLALIVIIKAVFLWLDPTPSYFYGDSESYLAVAILNWIPPDRSFLYGLLIRLVALGTHSLEVLIYLQTGCSCIAAWLLCYALRMELRTRFWIAALFSLVCAIEPLQLMMERYVMTEATSNFLFTLHFVLILGYLRNGKLWALLLAQALAVMMIGIRISFLPEVLMNSVLVPLLSPAAIRFYKSLQVKLRKRVESLDRARLKLALVHLAACLIVSQGCFSAYKHWYGHLKHREPALFYENGAFLIADLAPLVKKSDFPAHTRRDAILKRVTIDRTNIRFRLAHHFSDGGLWHSIQSEYTDPKEANRVALKTAIHALLRDPLGAAIIAGETYASYFQPGQMRSELLTDEGVGGHLSPDAEGWLRDRLGVQDPESFRLSLTKRWHRRAIVWYWIILAALPISPALLFLTGRNLLPSMLVIVATALVFLVGVTLTVDHPTPRYLTTDAWIVLLIFGLTAESLISRFRASSDSKGW